MQTRAVRLYGVGDLRLEKFELPEPGDDEILAKIVTDSICMSSYKACVLGAAHKRVPDDVAAHPVIIGHEFCGELLEVGRRWRERYTPGERFTVPGGVEFAGRSISDAGIFVPIYWRKRRVCCTSRVCDGAGMPAAVPGE